MKNIWTCKPTIPRNNNLKTSIKPVKQYISKYKIPLAILVFLVLSVLALSLFYAAIGAVIHQNNEVTVPDIKGKPLDKALDILAQYNLSLAKKGVAYDADYPQGTIIRQYPPAGMQVREGKTIKATLSSGTEKVLVPDVVGKLIPEAESLLMQAGLDVSGVKEVYSLRESKGAVVTQNPVSGEITNRGNKVILTVSSGPPPENVILIPDFIGESEQKVEKWVQINSGRIIKSMERRKDVSPGTVLKQNPPPDSLLEPDHKIEITVSEGTKELSRQQSTLFSYNVPKGSGRVALKITLLDLGGERNIFEGYRYHGDTMEIPLSYEGYGRARIFVNGILVEERTFDAQ